MGSGSVIANFSDDLARSKDDARLPFWEQAYRLVFPGLARMEYIEDPTLQRSSIDRLVVDASGASCRVEEKLDHTGFWGVFLEYWSAQERSARGWIARHDAACDVFAYAFLKRQRVLFMPWRELRKAWIDNHKEWVAKHYVWWPEGSGARSHIPNQGYTTVGTRVPVEVLCAAVPGVVEASWSAGWAREWRPTEQDEKEARVWGL